jgi:hypothetical protein
VTLISLGAGELLQNDEVDTHWYDGFARRVSRPVQALRGVPHLGTWVGLLIAAAGAVLLVIAWARTAALTDVGLQVPYVVSAGLTGLGLVVVGMTVVSISAKVEDARERTRQLGELRELLAELRSAVEDQQ